MCILGAPGKKKMHRKISREHKYTAFLVLCLVKETTVLSSCKPPIKLLLYLYRLLKCSDPYTIAASNSVFYYLPVFQLLSLFLSLLICSLRGWSLLLV